MTQAAEKAITNTETPNIEVMPVACEYVALDEVRVSVKTVTGDPLSFTMKTASLLAFINMGVDLINRCNGQIFRDLGVF